MIYCAAHKHSRSEIAFEIRSKSWQSLYADKTTLIDFATPSKYQIVCSLKQQFFGILYFSRLKQNLMFFEIFDIFFT